MKYDTISPYHQLVENTVVKAVADAMGISEDHVRKLGVRPGSTVVDLLLVPAVNDSVLLQLRQQVPETGSRLRRHLVGKLITRIEKFALGENAHELPEQKRSTAIASQTQRNPRVEVLPKRQQQVPHPHSSTLTLTPTQTAASDYLHKQVSMQRTNRTHTHMHMARTQDYYQLQSGGANYQRLAGTEDEHRARRHSGELDMSNAKNDRFRSRPFGTRSCF